MADTTPVSVSIIEHFEQQVINGLKNAGIEPEPFARDIVLGVAVSGGADSIAMLTALAHICFRKSIKLCVITVNHHIRPDAETNGDACFVEEYCDTLVKSGFSVDCRIYELEKGAVDCEAEKRGRGVEEAARFLRYKAFMEFARIKGCTYICLAHNRNDQLETLLMRFLQGSGNPGAAGILRKRDIFVRPMLDIQRSDIEQYLVCQNISWCTDQTNSDIRFLRNRIRKKLMPFLDSLIPGWQHAVLAGSEKAYHDTLALDASAGKIQWKTEKHGVSLPETVFSEQPQAVRRRLLYRAFDLAECMNRIPYKVVREVCMWPETGLRSAAVRTADICIRLSASVIFVEKNQKKATQYGFFAIIDKIGEYELPCGTVTVSRTGNVVSAYIGGPCDSGTVYGCPALPFCIRSRQPDDRIPAADGSMKPLNDIFSSWHVEEKRRDCVPVIQELQTPGQLILCICGRPFGYDDWIVKQ